MSWNNISKWIWINEEQKNDTYGEFYSEFEYAGKDINIRISADSNYAIYLNNKYVYSGQYSDFPHYKIYDEISLLPYIKEGTNKLSIVVWYYGKSNLSYYPGNASLRFEVYQGENIITFSSKKTLSRRSKAFKNEYQKEITSQLGFSFLYDMTLDDNWKDGKLVGFEESREVKQDLPLFIRPIERNLLEGIRESKLIKKDKNYYLYDLGCEEVGFLNLKVSSNKKQKLIICYGEHIADGGVRYKIGDRNFSVEIIVGEGINEYINYFRRLGLRYLEIHSEGDIEIDYINVIKCEYPIKEKKCRLDNLLHQKIYDISVRTLKLCMHEHYEDCPWREQGLYATDSRNQMLCGYYAFEQTQMQRASLMLLAQSQLECGLLEMTAPAVFHMTIPAFSLVWIKALKEYGEHTNDTSFIEEMLPVAKKILNFFVSRLKDGLIITPIEKKYWNFYEWTDGMNNSIVENIRFDAPLNSLFGIELMDYFELCNRIGQDGEAKWAKRIYDDVKKVFHKSFYCENKKAYKTYIDGKEEHFSQLTQALALLSGFVDNEYKHTIRKQLVNKDFVETSLSFSGFKYDALLQDEISYREMVIDDIEKKWGYMLEQGATSFWETILGESDFSYAGSLCHGWSAIPVYYFHKLGLVK